MKFYMVKERIEYGIKTAYVQETSIKCEGDIYMDMLAMLGECDIICKSSYEAVQIAEAMNEKTGKKLDIPAPKTVIVWENKVSVPADDADVQDVTQKKSAA